MYYIPDSNRLKPFQQAKQSTIRSKVSASISSEPHYIDNMRGFEMKGWRAHDAWPEPYSNPGSMVDIKSHPRNLEKGGQPRKFYNAANAYIERHSTQKLFKHESIRTRRRLPWLNSEKGGQAIHLAGFRRYIRVDGEVCISFLSLFLESALILSLLTVFRVQIWSGLSML